MQYDAMLAPPVFTCSLQTAIHIPSRIVLISLVYHVSTVFSELFTAIYLYHVAVSVILNTLISPYSTCKLSKEGQTILAK